MGTAIEVVAVLTLLSGIQVAVRMRETLKRVFAGRPSGKVVNPDSEAEQK
jgi:hypothetical protein